MKKIKKLLFVDNAIESFYAYRMPLALAAKRAGYEVHVAAPHGRTEDIIIGAGLLFHPVQMSRKGINPVKESACIAELMRVYSEVKPDLIHHLRLKPVLYGGIASMLAQVPAQVSMPTGLGYVFTANLLKTRVLRLITLLGCKLAFSRRNVKVIFQNPDDREVFLNHNTVTAKKSIIIRGSGVDVIDFAPNPEPAGEPVIILPSRMLRDKGVAEFVEAAKMLKSEGVKARFVLVGDTDPGNPTAIETAVLQQWHDSGIIDWWGHQADMNAVMAKANIVCLPSYREGLPKVLIEAAACGRAIVTTDVPGCREIIRNGQNGCIVPPQDSVALAAALRGLIQNSDLRRRMGLRGRQIAVAEFSMDRVITETLAVYRNLLEMQPDPPLGAAKRFLDLSVSTFGLVMSAPLTAVIAVAIKLTSPGPILYKGLRIGLYGRPFPMYKFRSMVTNAEKLGGSATANDDPRITPIGAFLRRYKLDEIPQLLNVLKGEMSLVGPRPEVHKFVARYKGAEKAILSVQPGITDWASIWNSDEGSVLEGSPNPEKTYEELIRPTKTALQLRYVRERSLSVDLRILFHTALRLLWRRWTPMELAQVPPIKRYSDLRSQMIEQPKQEQATPAILGGKPMFSERFRFIAPTLPSREEVFATYAESYASGIITNGPCVARFEERAAERLGAKHCVAVSSCTSGLMLVMRALGLEGEIILPSFTFFATGHAIRWNGLRPVFAECDPETWCIDPVDVERRITSRTSAIVAVHMYGNPCAVDSLSAIAQRHGLKLIFDAAHAFGSRYQGRSIGQFGDAEVFSLSPTKVLVAGEGGLVATNDEHLAKALKAMRNYGDTGSYDPPWMGMNARMTEFNASLALHGLPHVEEKVVRRNSISKTYTSGLAGLAGVSFQKVDSRDTHTFKDYSIHVTADEFGMTRDELAAALLAENIETKKYFYPPMHRQTLYTEFQDGPLPFTDYVSDRVLSLPIYESLPDAAVERILQAIHRIHQFQQKTTKPAKEKALYATARV